MLKGKTAIITGSTSGIGLAIAEALAGSGCSIMLNGLGDAASIENTRAQLADRHNVPVRYHHADMRKRGEIAELIGTATSELGSVDILVNNAGIQHAAPIEEFPLEMWDAIVDINLTAAFLTIRAALPGMRQSGWGRIINVASVHGLTASPMKAAYVAAKHGLIGLTKVVALETAESGITCNAICPGWVRTALVEKQIEELARQHGIAFDQATCMLLEEKQPSKRFVELDQLGAMAVFLASDAASNMTGAELAIDGGWTAQ